MSKQQKTSRRKWSRSRLEATLRSRRSWTRWHQKRIQRRLQRETQRLVLLQRMVDSQLLLLKTLEQRANRLLVVQTEDLDSQQYREMQAQPRLVVLPPGTPEQVQQMRLGMDHLRVLPEPTVQPVPETAAEEIARLIGQDPQPSSSPSSVS